jgi:hypothetical protein
MYVTKERFRSKDLQMLVIKVEKVQHVVKI